MPLIGKVKSRLRGGLLALLSFLSLLKVGTSRFDLVFYALIPMHMECIRPVVASLMSREPSLRVCVVRNFGVAPLDVEGSERRALLQKALLPSHAGLLGTRVFVTPMVGLPRSFHSKSFLKIHMVHTMAEFSGLFEPWHFRYFDEVLAATHDQRDDFERDFVKRIGSNPPPRITLTGYPKLDPLSRFDWGASGDESQQTVLYAPTIEYSATRDRSSLSAHSLEIISRLLEAGFGVIFRPHPITVKYQAEVVRRIAAVFATSDRFRLDLEPSYVESFRKAGVMVTDLSGGGYTFTLLTRRPSIFFAASLREPEEARQDAHYSRLANLGIVVSTYDELLAVLERDSLAKLRRRAEIVQDTVPNIGSASEGMADLLTVRVAGHSRLRR